MIGRLHPAVLRIFTIVLWGYGVFVTSDIGQLETNKAAILVRERLCHQRAIAKRQARRDEGYCLLDWLRFRRH